MTSLSPPSVESGHVAAWVGVGGAGAGPGGSDEWIQIGLTATRGSATRLYYELKQPRGPVRLVYLDAVPPGEPHRVAVVEMAGRPNWWRAWVDGRSVGAPVLLPGSHRAWEGVATAESWDGGVPACNRYRYRFSRIAVATAAGGAWRPLVEAYPLEDPGYRLVRRAPASFLAFARG